MVCVAMSATHPADLLGIDTDTVLCTGLHPNTYGNDGSAASALSSLTSPHLCPLRPAVTQFLFPPLPPLTSTSHLSGQLSSSVLVFFFMNFGFEFSVEFRLVKFVSTTDLFDQLVDRFSTFFKSQVFYLLIPQKKLIYFPNKTTNWSQWVNLLMFVKEKTS